MSKDEKWIHSWGSANLRGACRVSSRVTGIGKGNDPSTGSSKEAEPQLSSSGSPDLVQPHVGPDCPILGRARAPELHLALRHYSHLLSLTPFLFPKNVLDFFF